MTFDAGQTRFDFFLVLYPSMTMIVIDIDEMLIHILSEKQHKTITKLKLKLKLNKKQK
jgi:hypothetical protein